MALSHVALPLYGIASTAVGNASLADGIINERSPSPAQQSRLERALTLQIEDGEIQERSGSGSASRRMRSPRTPILITLPSSPSPSRVSPLPLLHDGTQRRLRQLDEVRARLPDLTSKTLSSDGVVWFEAVGAMCSGPGKTLNQDRFALEGNDDAYTMGIFDGHGILGHTAATVCAEMVPTRLAAHLHAGTPTQVALPMTIAAANDCLLAIAKNEETAFSALAGRRQRMDYGTTATVCSVTRKQVHVCWAGDSRCIILQRRLSTLHQSHNSASAAASRVHRTPSPRLDPYAIAPVTPAIATGSGASSPSCAITPLVAHLPSTPLAPQPRLLPLPVSLRSNKSHNDHDHNDASSSSSSSSSDAKRGRKRGNTAMSAPSSSMNGTSIHGRTLRPRAAKRMATAATSNSRDIKQSSLSTKKGSKKQHNSSDDSSDNDSDSSFASRDASDNDDSNANNSSDDDDNDNDNDDDKDALDELTALAEEEEEANRKAAAATSTTSPVRARAVVSIIPPSPPSSSSSAPLRRSARRAALPSLSITTPSPPSSASSHLTVAKAIATPIVTPVATRIAGKKSGATGAPSSAASSTPSNSHTPIVRSLSSHGSGMPAPVASAAALRRAASGGLTNASTLTLPLPSMNGHNNNNNNDSVLTQPSSQSSTSSTSGNGTNDGNNDEWFVRFASVDHTPSSNSNERERVKANNGQLVNTGVETRVYPSGMSLGEAREAKLTINMSRALGHTVLGLHGVSPIPEVASVDLVTHSETIVVIASDGVWTVMDNDEVVRVVTSAPSLQQAYLSLLTICDERWRQQRGIGDNISITIANIQPLGSNDHHAAAAAASSAASAVSSVASSATIVL